MSASITPAAPALPSSRSAAERERREAFMAELRRVLPECREWDLWLKLSGELPPDFSTMRSYGEPPDPLARDAGGKFVAINSPEAWQLRREELLKQFHEWVLGRVPETPDNMEATVLREYEDYGATIRHVQLRFGPELRATLRLELLIPRGGGSFPVFLTQHDHRAWALIALRRGYLCCMYAGSDSRDDTDSFAEAYPEADWSRLTRRAWAAGRCIDYLTEVVQADVRKIALTGHAANGKTALIAAALDARISAVVSSSSGAGGCVAARDFSGSHFGESLEMLTRRHPEWFHPRLRFFAGREDKLPVDFNELAALAAPRATLISTALNDSVESTWAVQHTYLSARRVFRLLRAEDRLRVMWRSGGHETWPAVIERYLDWCDTHLGRARFEFPERLIHPANWEEWQQQSGERQQVIRMSRHGAGDLLAGRSGRRISDVDGWLAKRGAVRSNIAWMLGEAPPGASGEVGTYGAEAPHIRTLLFRSENEGLEKEQVVLGEYINADLYLPVGLKESERTAPGILWLHPFSYSNGYVAGYRRGEQAFRTLARAGFAVLCMDQIGFGRRIEEVEGFYRRYPRGSLLGKMLRDAQAGLNVLAGLPYVDPAQVWAVGYSLGAMIALHLGALDDRLAGIVSVCAPPPFRSDKQDRGTGGIRRWAHRHMLLPRLGFFTGEEERAPYDLPEILGAMAPRPILMVTPSLDREAPLAEVTQAVEAAREVYRLYGAEERLEQLAPEQFNEFEQPLQEQVTEWLRGHARF